MTRAAGADTVRIDLSWSTLEFAGPGQYDMAYAGKVDSFLRHARDRGVRVVATVWTTPCWASSAPDSVKQGCAGAWWTRGVERYPPSDPQRYGAIAGWIAQRWGRDLAGIEIWNEPNTQMFFKASDQAAAYVPLVRAAHPRIKAVAPNLPVVAGSLLYSDAGFLERLYANGIAGYYDAFSIHPYDEPALWAQTHETRFSFREGPPVFHQAMADHGEGDVPVWLTEFGYPTCPPATFRWCTTEEGQAAAVTDAFEVIRGWPFVTGAFVYELRDGGTDPGDFEQNMGLVRNDFSAKLGYDAFAAAMAPPPEPPPAPPERAEPPPSPSSSAEAQTQAGTAPPPAPEPVIAPAAMEPPFAGVSLRSRGATVRAVSPA